MLNTTGLFNLKETLGYQVMLFHFPRRMQFTFTIYHPTGTCKMGPNYDDGAVVDSRLRVYGAYAIYFAISVFLSIFQRIS